MEIKTDTMQEKCIRWGPDPRMWRAILSGEGWPAPGGPQVPKCGRPGLISSAAYVITWVFSVSRKSCYCWCWRWCGCPSSLSLMSARPTVTFPASECHRPWLVAQGSHKPGKPGIIREFCKPGKVGEKSGNLRCGQGSFCDMSHGSRLA